MAAGSPIDSTSRGGDAGPAPDARAIRLPPARETAIVARLWRPGDRERGVELFALLDGARDPRIIDHLSHPLVESLCLFRGRVHPRLARAAPHLAAISPRSRLTHALLSEGWGRHWGVFLRSKVILHDLLRHFRRLLVVQDEQGRRLFFRFYDPRILRVYLPTCNAPELNAVFGPVEAFLIEGEDAGTLLEFSLLRGALTCREIPLAS